ncbi:ribbon-helix-helix protein, CopG family [Lysobacter enzymogenes]|uniref:ribbon-helix-helix protein, CopG family n=1 Tax=Lysobacter enzymogenes TaxID=69 RepID=UPI001A95A471|nr:ribbon-helix-helix protein, CopG family [Lysobacter enzymogenes]QQP97773.1 CopG family transcriptional regulator [Lysobacter enzymogenes]
MLSVRLPSELETQLDFLARASGQSKNQIVAQALADHFKTVELGSLPLQQAVQENAAESMVQRQKAYAEQYQHAHEIADWCQRNAMFTAKPNNGTPGRGVHGRNVPVGFSDSFDRDRTLYVIARHMPAYPSYGTDRYHLYVRSFQEWKDYMMEVRPA